MPKFDDTRFQDRRSRAAEAKKALLSRLKSALDPDSPAAIESRLGREAIASARAKRSAERELIRQEQQRELDRQAALAAEAERAAAELAALKEAEEAAALTALKAEQKAARDARYAARKEAKKTRRRGY